MTCPCMRATGIFTGRSEWPWRLPVIKSLLRGGRAGPMCGSCWQTCCNFPLPITARRSAIFFLAACAMATSPVFSQSPTRSTSRRFPGRLHALSVRPSHITHGSFTFLGELSNSLSPPPHVWARLSSVRAFASMLYPHLCARKGVLRAASGSSSTSLLMLLVRTGARQHRKSGSMTCAFPSSTWRATLACR